MIIRTGEKVRAEDVALQEEVEGESEASSRRGRGAREK